MLEEQQLQVPALQQRLLLLCGTCTSDSCGQALLEQQHDHFKLLPASAAYASKHAGKQPRQAASAIAGTAALTAVNLLHSQVSSVWLGGRCIAGGLGAARELGLAVKCKWHNS
jgi:hypothetical protein